MFYLKEFFKTIADYPLRGMTFLFLSSLFALSLTHRPWVSEIIEKITPDKMVNPYFIALSDDKIHPLKFKKILEQIPGVVSVDETESQRSRQKITALVEKLGEEYSLSQELMNFNSLRIVLKQSLSLESLEFVRQQVLKLGGKEHIRASEIRFPEITAVLNAHPFFDFLSHFGDWGVVGVLGGLWVISFWSCYDVFRSRAYITEKFQRKNFVAAKNLASGLILITLIFNGFGLWNETLKFFDSLVLVSIFSFFWAFSLQEWRWKSSL